LKQSGGTAYFDSYDLSKNRAAIRAMTGYLPQRFSQFTRLKTWEFLDYSGSLAGVRDKKKRREEMEELLDALGLTSVRDEFANDLSPVMKRHLEIAQAVIGSPRILLVDEPTLGLSPEERIRVRSLLSLKSGGVEVIIITSHIFADISSTCDRVAVLNEGRVVFEGPPSDVPDQEARREWAIDGPPPGTAQVKQPANQSNK
jgi:ABC-type multidrug transport system ATPase subunit